MALITGVMDGKKQFLSSLTWSFIIGIFTCLGVAAVLHNVILFEVARVVLLFGSPSLLIINMIVLDSCVTSKSADAEAKVLCEDAIFRGRASFRSDALDAVRSLDTLGNKLLFRKKEGRYAMLFDVIMRIPLMKDRIEMELRK